MKNLATIKQINGTYKFTVEFNELYQDDYYIIIDVEETGNYIGRKLLDDNPGINNINDIDNNEIHAYIDELTDELHSIIKDEVDNYLDRNL